MSKNLTRKGLAIGAVVALGTSLFAGTPAHAAAAITAAPSTGTGYTVLANDTFTVKVYGNVDFTAGFSALAWKVTQPSATATVAYDAQGAATVSASALSTSTVKYLVPSAVVTTAGGNTLNIDPTIAATGASSDYIVQPFLDLDGDGALDTSKGDFAGNAVTVKFKKGTDVTPVLTLDPVSASQEVTGTVKFTDTDFNYAQSTLANTSALVVENTSDFTSPTVLAVTLNTDENGFEFTTAGTPSISAGDVVAAKARVNGDSDTTYKYSSVVYSTADAASSALGAALTVTRGENIAPTAGSGLTADYAVRTGTKSFSYRVDFYKEAGKVNLLAAGKPVRITINELNTTIVTNDVIRVNGKKLTGAAGDQTSPVLNTVTDANGGVTVTVESDLALAGDSVEITVLATGSTGTIQAQNDFTWTDAALSSFANTNAQVGGDGSGTAYANHAPDKLTVVKGSSVTLTYTLRDQFGKVWAPTTHDYRISVAKGGTGTLTLSTVAAFSAGVATVTYTDNTTDANNTTTVVATLESKLSSGTTFGGVNSTDSAIASANAVPAKNAITTNLNIIAAAHVASKITLDAAVDDAGAEVSDADGAAHATNKVTKSDATLAAKDLRSNTNGASLANSYGAHLAGTVKQADGSNASGVAVTIKATGLFFSTDLAGSKYVVADSITVNTDEAGTYDVWALASKGGTFAISIASGSVTKTQTIKWAAAAATSGKNITITAPSASLPGRAVDVVVLLTDKYGAPVQTTTTGVERLSIALTGPGSNTAIAATTDADGKISFKLIFGSNDTGVATIKVTYDADGDTATNSPIVVSQNINVSTTLPTTATAAVSGSTGKFFVSATAAAGKSVVVKVAGKFVTSFKATGSKKSVAVKATKGSKKVTVFVGGKLVATKTVTVK
jgi:hypothetical protein